MTLTLHKNQVHCSGFIQLAVHSWPLLCLQREVAKLVSGFFYCCYLLLNNNMATNLQSFASSKVVGVGVLPLVTVERRYLGK